MIDTQNFVNALRDQGVTLFTGVPDSLLGSFSACLLNNPKPHEHIITANEGNAVGLAIGHYLATGKPAVVYMQNSGLGNTINPLTSLADPDVYAIPMLLIIGWRGEPGTHDEPQHVKQGRITLGQLELLNIPYEILDEDANIHTFIPKIWQNMLNRNGPAALVIRKGALTPVSLLKSDEPNLPLREESIACLLGLLDPHDVIIATTGKTGRELFELRLKRDDVQHDFLTVGGMGHTASLALGVALAQPHRRVLCLDGDGSLLMHMGATAITGSLAPSNFIHVLLNNRAHESVGGQPTVAASVDFGAVITGCGYTTYHSVRKLEELSTIWQKITTISGPHLLEIHLKQGSRKDLGRPTTSPIQNKDAFMEYLSHT